MIVVVLVLQFLITLCSLSVDIASILLVQSHQHQRHPRRSCHSLYCIIIFIMNNILSYYLNIDNLIIIIIVNIIVISNSSSSDSIIVIITVIILVVFVLVIAAMRMQWILFARQSNTVRSCRVSHCGMHSASISSHSVCLAGSQDPSTLKSKCFNHVHVQRLFTKFSVFMKRLSLLNPRVRTNFVAFPLERTGKSLKVWFDFGPRLGFSKQLFGSSREGTELDWTCFKEFL